MHSKLTRAVALAVSMIPEDDVLFLGAHHAREWISVEVPLRLAE